MVGFIGNFVEDYNSVGYEPVPNSNPPAAKPKGEVIIVKLEDKDNVTMNPGDVLVIDCRDNTTNPNMRVENSYAVYGDAKKNYVIDALLEYNLNNPSENPWMRTRESMLVEWRMHNLAYSFYFWNAEKQLRAANVDFDNNEEGTVFGILCLDEER